ncbi:hypothetical protein [Rosistilla oblonga]|uniref:hypothetical protein n=1 Tax=Rosistilla oblonga TaxID=2527990 RepID=UPI003A9837D0
MRLLKFGPLLLMGLLISGIQGCSSPETDPTTPTATPASDTAEDHADAKSPMDKMMPGLKELSPQDYKSAMAQHICPVSGEMLGTMGAPKKVDVDGEAVWICCDGCKAKLLAEPDKYLAKLK